MVVWDKEDYILEAIYQLGDSNVYLKLDSIPSEHLQKVIDDAISIIRERADMDEKTLEYFFVNDPKLGRFYLLPKIHKRLNGVPGRPVISNSGYLTENNSEFLDHHLQPLAKKVPSYIKDTNHFLQNDIQVDQYKDTSDVTKSVSAKQIEKISNDLQYKGYIVK